MISQEPGVPEEAVLDNQDFRLHLYLLLSLPQVPCKIINWSPAFLGRDPNPQVSWPLTRPTVLRVTLLSKQ